MKDNYFASVGGVVFRGDTVLLARHTYGSVAGQLLIPSGFIQEGEMPYAALEREMLEETGVIIRPLGLLSVRCSATNWWMVFLAEHVSGEPRSDGDENSEVLYMPIDEALERPDVTSTSKFLIRLAREKEPIGIHPGYEPQSNDKRILFG